MVNTVELKAFARRYVADAGLRRDFGVDPDGVLSRFGLSGKIAQTIRSLLARGEVETVDGVAALKATLREPDSELWL